MYSLFVGIDVSKADIHVAICVDGKSQFIDGFSNDHDGFQEMIKSIKHRSDIPQDKWFICFENTGVYSKSLLEYLISRQILCREENALKVSKSMGFRRGKDDKIDAQDLSLYAYRHRDSLQPTELAPVAIRRLKKLLSRRELLVKHRKALEVSLKDQHLDYESKLYEQMIQNNQDVIALYKRQIRNIENLIAQTIDETPELKTNDRLIQSIKGIGPIISAYLIAYTDNFKSFENARKFACYCGIAPFPNRSGSSIKGKSKVSPMANKKIKGVLTNGAQSAIAFDNQIRIYYLRKRAEGKQYGTVINAVKNKMIQRVFAVIKRQSPYVELGTYI